NIVRVGTRQDAMQSSFIVKDINWVSVNGIKDNVQLLKNDIFTAGIRLYDLTGRPGVCQDKTA
ncbi:MAG: hypothetical protein U5K27_21465, partial [Desulfotignum sp.]|nr:hypothetical protein [Desulfotignum sp.]